METTTKTRDVEIFKCFYCKNYVPASSLETKCPSCGRTPKTTTKRLIVTKIKAVEMKTETTTYKHKFLFFGKEAVVATTYSYTALDPKNQSWVDSRINSKGIKVE